MTDKVVGIHGVVPEGQPFPALVEDLEKLLERAKKGELRGLAVAWVDNREVLGTAWTGASGTKNPLGMAIACLAVRYPLAVMGGST